MMSKPFLVKIKLGCFADISCFCFFHFKFRQKKFWLIIFGPKKISGPNICYQHFFGPQKNLTKIIFFQLLSAKQPNLIITRNGFDIIVN